MHNHFGKVLVSSVTQLISFVSVEIAEVLTTIRGLHLARQFNIDRIEIELNCLTVVNAVKSAKFSMFASDDSLEY